MKKVFKTIKHEFFEILPPTIFFLIAFTLLMVTKRLIQRQYGVPLSHFMPVIIGALLVGKVVLLSDKLSLINRFPDKPLIYNIFWKTLIYFLAALIFCYIEEIIPLWKQYSNFLDVNRHLIDETIWSNFWIIMIWLSVLFCVYCTMREFIHAIGKEKVLKIFLGLDKTDNV